MKNVFKIFISIVIPFWCGCSYFNEADDLKKTSLAFFENLTNKRYDSCISLMAMDTEEGKKTNLDTFKLGLANFRASLVNNFGENFEYKFVKVKYRFIKTSEDSEYSKSTNSFIQISNDKFFCIYKIIFDENSKKIYYVSPPDRQYSVPDLSLFWLLGIIAIILVSFIIHTVLKIYKSELEYKWIYYIITILLSTPTFVYSVMGGFSLNFLSIQFSLGVSFKYGAYMVDTWNIAIPLGAIISRYAIYSKKKRLLNPAEETYVETFNPEIESEILEEKNINYSIHEYNCNGITFKIEQEYSNPNIGEKVYISDKLAPSDKYKIGFMSYIEVEDGIIVKASSF